MAALLSSTHVATLTARERDLLRLRALEYGEELSRVIVPLHESVGRSKPHRPGYVNALTPHSLLFHGKRMRLLLGWEHFKIQMGLSSEAAMEEYVPHHAEFTDLFYRKAAGNAFSNDAFATVVIAIWAISQWGSVHPADMSGLGAVRAARLRHVFSRTS